ncbi:hypothetical protein DL95DRAFT_383990 [Leptodontidium sp. 2 PMI_412]|nr:hypothetical protein DL95DRAFT_383990 [Leptodontidium sp. 2 PMI_412]
MDGFALGNLYLFGVYGKWLLVWTGVWRRLREERRIDDIVNMNELANGLNTKITCPFQCDFCDLA